MAICTHSGAWLTWCSGHIADASGLLRETQMPWQEFRKVVAASNFLPDGHQAPKSAVFARDQSQYVIIRSNY